MVLVIQSISDMDAEPTKLAHARPFVVARNRHVVPKKRRIERLPSGFSVLECCDESEGCYWVVVIALEVAWAPGWGVVIAETHASRSPFLGAAGTFCGLAKRARGKEHSFRSFPEAQTQDAVVLFVRDENHLVHKAFLFLQDRQHVVVDRGRELLILS